MVGVGIVVVQEENWTGERQTGLDREGVSVEGKEMLSRGMVEVILLAEETLGL